MSNLCSKITDCRLHLTIECVHCGVINHVSQSMDDDPTNFDIEEIKCWGCQRCSLIDESLLDMYPEYPEESTGACFDGKSSPDYT